MTILESERLLFRDHALEDLESFCEMEADPEVRRFVGGRPRTREAAEHKFRSIFLEPVPHRMRLWATIFKPETRYIGYCGIHPLHGSTVPLPREGALGFYLARAYWGRGIATEAARAFIEFGFTELRLSRIVASVEVGNAASIRVIEKLGFALWRLEKVGVRSFYHLVLPNPAISRWRGGYFDERRPEMNIQRSGTQPSAKGPAEYFTGTVRIDPLFQPPEPTRALGVSVTFEPGARTAWHTHPIGQTLIVTAGCGLVQSWGGPVKKIRPGDVVWCPPGEKHWHGATTSTAMSHIAIVELLDGKAVDWMERVTDEEYQAGSSAE